MKTALSKSWRWLLGALLGILGFSGCDKFGLFRCEYGTPNADFKLVGDVKDAKGKPIQGICVIHVPSPNEQRSWENDTVYSDASGHFEIERLKHDWPDNLENSTVRFEDVDGAVNGSYKTRVLSRSEMDLEQTGKGDKHWYSGAFTLYADAVLEEDD